MLTIIILETITAFFFGTVVFDCVHFALHQCLKSKAPVIKAIGQWHNDHHRFYTTTLKVRPEYAHVNLLHHVLLEYVVQVSAALFCILFFKTVAVIFAILLQTLFFINVCLVKGKDLHHRSYAKLTSYRGGPFTTADYHALHHVYPNFFYSSYIKLFDYICGTALPLANKRVAMTGANGALGSQMKRLLEKHGAIVTSFKYGIDYDYQSYDKLANVLAQTDILFLCHGSKFEFAQQANCDSFVSIIELFKKMRVPQFVPPEVWAVGSEIECHPCFGIEKIKVYAKSKRNFAKFARQYFRQRDFQYRHIVHSAFTSQMGPGLMSAKFAAWMTLFLLKRGLKYVPVSYTGFAYLNYLRFMFIIPKALKI